MFWHKELDFKQRYAENWYIVRKQALRATRGRCCLCRRKAAEVHHVRYRDWRGAIAGREKPLVDIFPLCLEHHSEAHSSKNWIKDKRNPVLGNRNTEWFIFRLQFGAMFGEWIELLRWVAVGFAVALVVAIAF